MHDAEHAAIFEKLDDINKELSRLSTEVALVRQSQITSKEGLQSLTERLANTERDVKNLMLEDKRYKGMFSVIFIIIGIAASTLADGIIKLINKFW